MAKNENQPSAEEKRQVEERSNENSAERGGEGVSATVDSGEARSLEQGANPMSFVEEIERQAAEQYPRNATAFSGQHETGPEKARQGHAATSRAEVGRVVTVHEDTEHEGEVYKAGIQDIPLDVADRFIADGKAYEPAGKKKGR